MHFTEEKRLGKHVSLFFQLSTAKNSRHSIEISHKKTVKVREKAADWLETLYIPKRMFMKPPSQKH